MADGFLKRWGRRLGTQGAEEVQLIPLEAVSRNPYQPRKVFEEDELEGLARSIEEYGVLQPVVVRKRGHGYELIAGERRLRAAEKAGLKAIPALVRELSDEEVALQGLVENLQRRDLSFLEEAEGYRQLMEKFGFTQGELARRLGKSQSAIANKLRLLNLPAEIREAISREIISERHARALLRLPDCEQQREVLEEIRRKDLNVREAEELIEGRLQGISRAKEGSGRRKQKITRVFKDIRIFVNSFREAVNTLRKVGFDARMEQEDRGDYIEICVRIPKKRGARKRGRTG